MQPTRDTSTLDLIVTDMVEYYEIPAILAPLSTSDHNVINWKSKCNIAEKGNLTKIKVRQFRQQQLEQFEQTIIVNWTSRHLIVKLFKRLIQLFWRTIFIVNIIFSV